MRKRNILHLNLSGRQAVPRRLRGNPAVQTEHAVFLSP
jgi:hypothetical protein